MEAFTACRFEEMGAGNQESLVADTTMGARILDPSLPLGVTIMGSADKPGAAFGWGQYYLYCWAD